MSGPFRIEQNDRILPRADSKAEPVSSYVDKVIKLIPSEVLVAYIAVKGLFPNTADPLSFDSRFLPIWTLIGFGLVIISRIFGTRENTGSGSVKTVQWGVVAISSISFLIWAYAMGDTVLGFTLPDPRIVSVVVVVWTFLVPQLFKSN